MADIPTSVRMPFSPLCWGNISGNHAPNMQAGAEYCFQPSQSGQFLWKIRKGSYVDENYPLSALSVGATPLETCGEFRDHQHVFMPLPSPSGQPLWKRGSSAIGPLTQPVLSALSVGAMPLETQTNCSWQASTAPLSAPSVGAMPLETPSPHSCRDALPRLSALSVGTTPLETS